MFNQFCFEQRYAVKCIVTEKLDFILKFKLNICILIIFNMNNVSTNQLKQNQRLSDG